MQNDKKTILIVGGGTAGWMTAAALARFLPQAGYKLKLVESDRLGTVGVGEATIPHIRHFNDMLGLDENDFIRSTGATYKLGIQFTDWGPKGTSYVHPFGLCGHDISGIDFHHFWLRLKSQSKVAAFDDYSAAVVAALSKKFQYPKADTNSPLSEYSYAFHLDATLYARYLRTYATDKGVDRIEGEIVDATRSADGDIASVKLSDGRIIEADLFVDCSGFRALLIEKTLSAGYEDWSHWLPCNRAVAAPSERSADPLPYTKAMAQSVGWQWQIPLQHRTGNGFVFADGFLSEDEATQKLLETTGADAGEVRSFQFVTGKRVASWRHNCIAIGLSAGFLEPLESTSIYLIQVAIQKLLAFFPGGETVSVERDEFNRQMDLEYERVRDFLILHYNINGRRDSEFWRHCAAMDVPAGLKEKLALFEETGRLTQYRQGLFMPASWLAVFFGQGFIPKNYDPRVDSYSLAAVESYLENLRGHVSRAVAEMQSHTAALDQASRGASVYPPSSMSLYGAGNG